MSHPTRRHVVSALAALVLPALPRVGLRDVHAQRAGRNPVEFAWSGAITTSSARVHARVNAEGAKVRILVDENTSFEDPKRSHEATAEWAKNGRTVSANFDGLDSGALYHYAVEVNGVIDTGRRGRFRTFQEGPHSF